MRVWGRATARCVHGCAGPRYPAVCNVSSRPGDAQRKVRRMPRAAYSAWRAAYCAGRTVQARAAGAWTTIGTSATAVTHSADACSSVSGGSCSGRRMPLARQRMVRQPIQLLQCSAGVVPTRLRDFCYARRGRLSGVLTFDHESAKYGVSAPATCSRVLQIGAQNMIRVGARVIRRYMLQTEDADPLTKWHDHKERLRAYLLLLVWGVSDASSAR